MQYYFINDNTKKTYIMLPMKRIIPLSIITLMQGICIGILIPVMAHYVISLGLAEEYSPLIFSTYSFCAFVSSFFWGKITDKIGRKFALFISIVGITFAYAWLTVASNLWEVFVARGIAGAMSGFMIAAFAWVGDSFKQDDRTKAFGALGASFATGFLIGIVIAIILVQQTAYVLAFFGATLVSLLSVFAILFWFNEADNYVENKRPSFLELFKEKRLRPTVIVAIIVGVGFTMIEGSFAVYILAEFDAIARDVAIAMAISTLFSIVIQGGITSRIVKKIGEIHTIRFGIVFLIAGLGALIEIQSVGMYVPLIFVGIAMALYSPALQSYVMKISPPHLRGSSASIIQSISSFSRVIGPTLATVLMAMYWNSFIYFAGILLLAIPYIILRFMR